MPYRWSTDDPANPDQELTLWPYNSLPAKGFAAFILGTFLLATIPLYALLGTVLLWGMLPFFLAALAGIWYALRRNAADRRILEVLRLSRDDLHLTRYNPGGDTQDWHCNPYWAQVAMHKTGGPVPFYVTLTGGGREVEIGAFLSEDERKTLYSDLADRLRHAGVA